MCKIGRCLVRCCLPWSSITEPLLGSYQPRIARARPFRAQSTRATSGDTVMLPPGCNVVWNQGVNIPATKGIVLNGSGARVARGNLADKVPLIRLAPNEAVSTRITGFIFTESKSAWGSFVAVVGGNELSAPFRVDHCDFTGLDLAVHIQVATPAYGVIDHNSFVFEGSNEVFTTRRMEPHRRPAGLTR